jgi:Mg-chelatase subunit ChlD
MRKAFCGAAAAALLCVCAAGPVHAQGRQHTFYAHITDGAGAPIAGLSGTDFGIIEAGQVRRIVRAAYGGVPLRVLFLVDTSESISKFLNPMRAAAQALIDGIPSSDEISLVSLGRQMRIRAQPSMDHKKAKDEAARIFSEGGGTVLLDGLTEAYDRLLAKVEDRGGVIVILTTDGPESSTATREEQYNRFLQTVVQRGITVHAAIVGNMGNTSSQLPSASSGTQSVVAINLTGNTGGHLDSVAVPTALADKMTAIAGMIRAQQEKMKGWYQIDYLSDTPGPGQALDVTVSRIDAKVELSDRAPR